MSSSYFNTVLSNAEGSQSSSNELNVQDFSDSGHHNGVHVGIRDVKFVDFEAFTRAKDRGIGARGLGGCTVCLFIAGKKAILAHVTPGSVAEVRPQMQQLRAKYISKGFDRLSNVKAHIFFSTDVLSDGRRLLTFESWGLNDVLAYIRAIFDNIGSNAVSKKESTYPMITNFVPGMRPPTVGLWAECVDLDRAARVFVQEPNKNPRFIS